MRFLMKDDNKTYSLEKFDEDKGIIYLKNTTKTTKKENIKEFLYVAEDEKELQKLILNYVSEAVETQEASEEVIAKITKPKSKKKNG